MVNIYASSGRYSDIQAAVNQALVGDNVFIPEVTDNFVEPGELMPSPAVVIPAGVNLFGAPTERTSGAPEEAFGRSPNDQVVAWKTALVIPLFDCAPTPPGAPGGAPCWIEVRGTGNPLQRSRISDIKFIGHRNIDPNSTQMTKAIRINNAADFRVDHNHFLNLGGAAAESVGLYGSGVIDHNVAENPAGGVWWDWDTSTIRYGIQQSRGYTTTAWESDISKILGQYLNYSIYIEDNYFSKWRHCVTANHGAHYVARHNSFEGCYAFGDVDAHIGNSPTEIGTRALEIYSNKFINRDLTNTNPFFAFVDGGGGVIFDNYVDTYRRGIDFDTRTDRFPYTMPKDIWIWNNTFLGEELIHVEGSSLPYVREGIEYFLYAPHTFQYQTYLYPHPLTSAPSHTLTVNSSPITGLQFNIRKVA